MLLCGLVCASYASHEVDLYANSLENQTEPYARNREHHSQDEHDEIEYIRNFNEFLKTHLQRAERDEKEAELLFQNLRDEGYKQFYIRRIKDLRRPYICCEVSLETYLKNLEDLKDQIRKRIGKEVRD